MRNAGTSSPSSDVESKNKTHQGKSLLTRSRKYPKISFESLIEKTVVDTIEMLAELLASLFASVDELCSDVSALKAQNVLLPTKSSI